LLGIKSFIRRIKQFFTSHFFALLNFNERQFSANQKSFIWADRAHCIRGEKALKFFKNFFSATIEIMNTKLFFYSAMLIFSCWFSANAGGAIIDESENRGTLKRPIIDSRMTEKEAFDGLDPNCPPEIRKRQKLIKIKYYSFDQKIHQGQLVIDRDLVKDVQKIFKVALEERFPIYSIIPVSAPKFRKNGRWDDDLSMAANNTSAFNYREKTGGGSLSNHAYGRAIDINTFQNPYVKGKLILPPNAVYEPSAEGTITANSRITKLFLELGWDWGGSWTRLQDYQHFEKPLKK
jgi:peptidoglycan L-alanyl-D-glutamate endopeptidase CwlK